MCVYGCRYLNASYSLINKKIAQNAFVKEKIQRKFILPVYKLKGQFKDRYTG